MKEQVTRQSLRHRGSYDFGVHRTAELALQRGHRKVQYATRHDVLEVPRSVLTLSANPWLLTPLLTRNPMAAILRSSGGSPTQTPGMPSCLWPATPEGRQRLHQSRFQGTHVANRTAQGANVDDWIAHQLTGPVVGNLATAVDFVHGDVELGEGLGVEQHVVHAAPAAQSVDVRVLQKQHRVSDAVLLPQLHQGGLQRPRTPVLHLAQPVNHRLLTLAHTAIMGSPVGARQQAGFATMGREAVMAERRYWLFKSEPNAYSYADLQGDGVAEWDGVRNYQARNFLRDTIQEGDGILFYHSNAAPMAVVGTAVVVRSGYPDATAWDPASAHPDPKSTPDNPRWYVVDIRADREFESPVTLEAIKNTPGLEKMMVAQRGARLSIQPVTPEEWDIITKMGGVG